MREPLNLRVVEVTLDERYVEMSELREAGRLLLAHARAARAALTHLRDEIRGQRVHGTLKDALFETRQYWAQVESVADDVLAAATDGETA